MTGVQTCALPIFYGNATFEETRELQEEGIDVATIPWAPKEDA